MCVILAFKVDRKDEDEIRHILNNLESTKHNMAREAERALMKQKQTEEVINMKRISIFDSRKQLKEIYNSLGKFTQLYEVVKNQKNKFISFLHDISDTSRQLKEKLKGLQDEIDLLQKQRNTKENSLEEAKLRTIKVCSIEIWFTMIC